MPGLLVRTEPNAAPQTTPYSLRYAAAQRSACVPPERKGGMPTTEVMGKIAFEFSIR